jgi:hypothetical protein
MHAEGVVSRAKKERRVLPTVMDRIVEAGHQLSRCSGTQEWVKRDWGQLRDHAAKLGRDPAALTFGHCNFTHLVDTASDARAREESKGPFLRGMGQHRSW